MSEKFASPLVLEVTPSRRLAGVVIGLHVGAGVLLLVLALPFYAKLLGGVTLVLSLHTAWRALTRLRELAVDSEEEWTIRLRADREPRPCVPTAHLVAESLVLMSMRLEGRRWPLTAALAADSLTRDAFRRLRARLKTRSPAG